MESSHGASRKTGKITSWSRSRGGTANHSGNPEAARPNDPEYWAWKTQAEDMKNAKTFLQQGPLTADGIEQFDTWKEDILRATQLVMLTGR